MKKIFILIVFALLPLWCTGTSVAAEPGISTIAFNKRLLPRIKTNMTYGRIAALAGTQGIKLVETGKAKSSTTLYRWKGRKSSVLTARFGNDRLLEAWVLVPNGRTFAIRKDGKIEDLGYVK